MEIDLKLLTQIVLLYLEEMGCLDQVINAKIEKCTILSELEDLVNNEISPRFGIDVKSLSMEHYLTASNLGWIDF
jgi:hypothetical protein